MYHAAVASVILGDDTKVGNKDRRAQGSMFKGRVGEICNS